MAWLNHIVCFLLLVLATADRETNRGRERADSGRLFRAFPHALAAFTSSNDTAFKCSSATRTHFNPQAKTVTYVWHFKAQNGHPARDVVFDISFGHNSPGQATWTVNNDTAHRDNPSYEYSDYSTCVVMKFRFEAHDHCTLWVKKSVKHNIPQHCLDKYEETCDYRVPLIDTDLCKDEDD